MPENEFEKKVSSELQQLKFKPSDTVWMKVEERIRGKKKRRVFIIFFLLAGITLLGYWQWNNFFDGKKTEVVQTETSTIEKNSNLDKNDIDIKKQDDLSKEKQAEAADVKNKEENEQMEAETTVSTNKINKDTPSNISTGKRIEKKQNSVSVEKRIIEPKNKKKVLKYIQRREVALTDNDLTVIAPGKPIKTKDDVQRSPEINGADQDVSKNFKPTDNKIDSARLSDIDSSNVNQVKPSQKPDSVIKKDSIAKKMDSVLKAVSVDSPVVKLPKNSFDKKWKFGIEFTPGISSFKEDIFSFNMNKSADLNASPGTVSGAVPFAPVKTSSGFGFQIGGYVKKQFTRKSSLTLGMRWAYYSDKLHIGTRMYRTTSPSSSFSQALYSLGVNSAYRADGGTSSYKENYHFIEFPVNYQVQINKSSIHPLSLYIGVKIGRLLSSNAVAYDTVGGGIYYQSTKYLNKTQFGFTGGLSWKINKHDKFQITAGPVLDLHLNSLVDNPFDKKKYLLFTGLRTSVFFNSKK